MHVRLSHRRNHQLLADPGFQPTGALRLRVDQLQAQRPVAPQGSLGQKSLDICYIAMENDNSWENPLFRLGHFQ